MKVRNVEFGSATHGWVCDLYFSHTTARQFSDEHSLVRGVSRYWWWAFVRARRLAKQHAASLAPKPGERGAKGW